MKKLNSYVPIWLLILVPPLLLILAVYNIAMAFIISLLLCFVYDKINIEKISDQVFKKIGKIFLFSSLLDLITSLLYFLVYAFKNIDFLNENLIKPIETNPYTNIISLIYVLIIVGILIFLIYLFVNKIAFNLKKIQKVFIMLLLFPYLMFIPSNMVIKTEYNSLTDYKSTDAINDSKVKGILKNLKTSDYQSSYIVDKSSKPYTLKIYIQNLDSDYQMYFEEDASILFNLITNINEVVFVKDDKKYTYSINYINNIFKDVKKKSLTAIYERYESQLFSDYTYMGRVNEYDLFDTSEYCELENQLLFEYDYMSYYLKCTNIEKLVLHSSKKDIVITDALKNNIITEEDLINSNIDLIKK